MKKFILGLIVGLSFALCATAFASDIKQYILTAVGYPVVVNGVEYKDATNPILNYEGSTYVPLAKLGDITGVNYKWNDQLKRVEIGTGGIASTGDATTIVSDNGQLRDAAAIIAERESIKKLEETPTKQQVDAPNESTLKGLVQENGETVLYAYDKFSNYRGIFKDGDDPNLITARAESRKELPPKISDGWLSAKFLSSIYSNLDYENKELLIKSPLYNLNKEVFYRFPISTDFIEQKNGETTSNGVQIKLYEYGLYFNIADLQKAGMLQ